MRRTRDKVSILYMGCGGHCVSRSLLVSMSSSCQKEQYTCLSLTALGLDVRDRSCRSEFKDQPPSNKQRHPLTLRRLPGASQHCPRDHHQLIHSSSQHLSQASCPLFLGCAVPEGSLREAHPALLEEPGLAGKGDTWTPGPPR